MSARTLVVLDVDGRKLQYNVIKHTSQARVSHSGGFEIASMTLAGTRFTYYSTGDTYVVQVLLCPRAHPACSLRLVLHGEITLLCLL